MDKVVGTAAEAVQECAAAGLITIAEVEELREPGELDPMHVHTPGIFVQRIVRIDRVATSAGGFKQQA